MKRIAFVILAACGGSSSSNPDAAGGSVDASVDVDAAPDATAACPRVAPTGDHAHVVVISHPFAQSGGSSNRWETLLVSATGAISQTHKEFEMGSMSVGQVAFTPDGQIAIAAQEDGTLGVVRLAPDGTPTVVHAHFTGADPFYATGTVVMAPSGDHAYVLNQQTRNNGGGVFRVDIACDGTLTDRGLVVAGKSPGGLIFIGGDRALIAAGDVGPAGSTGATAVGNDGEMLAWSDSPTFLGGADLFGDDTAIVGGTAITSDQMTFLVGDVNQFSSGEGSNRVAVATVGASGLTPVTVLPINDPIALVASPFGDLVLEVSGFGNAINIIDKNNGAWRVKGPITYQGAHPELPSGAVLLTGGALAGDMLVAELSGVRRVEMKQDGTVIDHGRFLIGDGSGDDIADIVGAIGAAP